MPKPDKVHPRTQANPDASEAPKKVVGSPGERSIEESLSAQIYAVIALVGLIAAASFTVFYIRSVPKLVDRGVEDRTFYVLLIPWGLFSAAFLFGAMKSYAKLTYRHLGSALELGGPTVLFCLVVVGGFKLVPTPNELFDLTVRPHAPGGSGTKFSSGTVSIDFGNTRRVEYVGQNGEANFKGIPSTFQGATIEISPEINGYSSSVVRQRLSGNVVDLTLQPKHSSVDLVGSIFPLPQDPSVIRIVVDGNPQVGVPDNLGRFLLNVNGEDGDRVRVRAYERDGLFYDSYVLLPGPVTMKRK